MSDFKIDDINNLQSFADQMDELISYWFGVDKAGGCAALPDQLVPEPQALMPNMGQQNSAGRLSGFTDGEQLYMSYNEARRELVGNPGEFNADPGSSAFAAFVDGLKHLSATVRSIYQNYDTVNKDDKLSVEAIKTMLNSPLPPAGSTGSTGTPT